MKKLVIFDLDGTLLNSIGDLAACCNFVLRQRGLHEWSYQEYCGFVGNGVTRLVERALPQDMRTQEVVAEVRRDFISHYTANIDRYTEPYAGVVSLLEMLTAEGVAVAIASNKFQSGTEVLAERFFPHIRFSAVLGQREGVAVKPDPAIVYQIMQSGPFRAEDVLYVGDSGVDMQTAAAAGVESVGVLWGFRTESELRESGANHIVNDAREVARIALTR